MDKLNYIVKSIAPEINVIYDETEPTCFDHDLKAISIGVDFQDDDCGFMRHIKFNHDYPEAEEYSLTLWSILHELGHYFTSNNGYISTEELAEYALCGLIPREIAENNESIQNMYFDIESEWNATEWAINWIKDNTDLARQFNDLLKQKETFMKTLTKSELNMAALIAERWESIGMFDYDYMMDFEETYDDIQYFNGCTKMCFITDELPGWVFKVTFNNLKFDYCKREADNYADAEAEGLGQYFASTYKVYECADGRAVIVQEELDVDEEAVSDSLYRYAYDTLDPADFETDQEISDSAWDIMYNFDDYERIDALFGGEKYIGELQDFIQEHRINDLHEANWGWSQTSGLVMMDFSGYGF